MQRRTALRALIAASLALTSIGGLGTAHATGNDAPRTTHHIERIAAPSPAFVARGFSVSCGYISCKVYFNRALTRNARDTGWLMTMGAGSCIALSGPAGAICAAAIGAQAGAISSFAGRFYEDGDCLKLKVLLPAGPIIPERHKRGERNCR